MSKKLAQGPNSKTLTEKKKKKKLFPMAMTCLASGFPFSLSASLLRLIDNSAIIRFKNRVEKIRYFKIY